MKSNELLEQNMIQFLYILCRDFIILGVPELIFKDHIKNKEIESFSNQYLYNWAKDYVKRLSEENK